MTEVEVSKFWNTHPCGDGQLGGLESTYRGDYEAFFTAYDRFRYTKEGHILRCLRQLDVRGKRLLEIGLGQGADAEQLIRRGALWSGLELTGESVKRVKTRLAIRNLPYEALKQGSVLEIPYANGSFDVVFSHGVLHHVPEIERAQEELHRVLKPSGELIVMLYAKWSLNYLVSIALVRRLGLAALYFFGEDPGGIFSQHLENARHAGLADYLKMRNFIHRNTDGPLNPYSKVYDLESVKRDFPRFRVARAYKRFMYAPPLPVARLPLERLLGWHLWVHLRPA